MKVKVKTVKQESFDVEISAAMKVADIKGAIETQCGAEKFPRDALQIVFKGKRWTDDDATVEDMGVADGAVIVVVVKPTKPAAPPAAAPVAEPSAPAEATATTAAAAPAADAPAEAATAVTGADAFATGSELQASIKAISEMGFEEAEVKRAMRAAFNNPERAVEYLMSGIPEHLAPPVAAPAAGAGAAAPAAGDAPAADAAAAVPAAAAAPAAAAGGPNAAPLDMWGAPAPAAAGGGAAAAAGGGGGGGVADLLQQVRSNPAAAQRIQQLLQSDPNQLMALLQELSRQNPEFAQQLQANPQATLGALMGTGGGGEGGMPAPGQMTVELTADDDAAVGRLEALGFSRMACVQAYIACERSEELAANYLLENATDEDMQ